MTSAPPLLDVEDLRVAFKMPDSVVRAVNGVSLTMASGETLAIVGESGSGKSVTALALMGLIAPRQNVSGAVRLQGRNLLAFSERDMRTVRGNEIGMIFQEPMTSLNPLMTVGRQIREAILLHRAVSVAAADRRAVELLQLVGIPAPEARARDYPHQLSGGMRQRVMIAIGLACDPKILIADEPTTALDVTIQAQVLTLIADLKTRTGTAVLLITHDLGVVAQLAQRVIVMYAGRKVEEASVLDLFENPKHPYTEGLLRAAPRLGATEPDARLAEIPGQVPSPTARVVGCVFADRCFKVQDLCRRVAPLLEPKAPAHTAACHFAPVESVS